MNKRNKYLLRNLIVFIFLVGLSSCTNKDNEVFSEVVKVSLRNAGHHLLLANKDSTSLVKPVLELDELKYQLSFKEKLFIHPDSLVTFVKYSFDKSDLPQHYLVEVLRCKNKEVVYSYEIKQHKEKDIIPCRGRELEKGCYLIHVRFTKKPESLASYLYLLSLSLLLLMIFVFYKKKNKSISITSDVNCVNIGSFQFYPEQHKLIKHAIEISLSKKECELLSIFMAKPNQIIRREELIKKVWEDNGVIVGRSLDTYISKLRKILKDDDTIKLTNIHGVGYKLEINLR